MGLCQHLGFHGIHDNGIKFGVTTKGESIVTGDFVCYNNQSEGTSCCAYLQPKTANTTDKIPFVACEYIPMYGLVINKVKTIPFPSTFS